MTLSEDQTIRVGPQDQLNRANCYNSVNMRADLCIESCNGGSVI